MYGMMAFPGEMTLTCGAPHGMVVTCVAGLPAAPAPEPRPGAEGWKRRTPMLHNCIVYFCDKTGTEGTPMPGWFDCVQDCFSNATALEAGASPSERLWLIPTWECFESAS